MLKQFYRRQKVRQRTLSRWLGPQEDWHSSLILGAGLSFGFGTVIMVEVFPHFYEYLDWYGVFLLELVIFPFATIGVWYTDKVEKRS